MIKAEIITTGEEVLSGEIVDTNASWIAQRLGEQGLEVTQRLTVGDRMEDLVACFRERSAHADVIIVNGGMGPTSDDLSAEAAGKAMDEPLVLFDSWVKELEKKFVKANLKMPESNLKQATLPASSEILDNPVGTACGFVIKLNRAFMYFTPGVPHELKQMITDQIIPHIRNHFVLPGRYVLRQLHVFGLAEASLGENLSPLVLPTGVKLGFRAHFPTLTVKVFASPADYREGIEAEVERGCEMVKEIVGENVVAEERATIETNIQEMMIGRGFTLAVAESCTGGMIADQLVSIPGSSGYLDRGFVTYTNAAKMEMLGVPESTLATHGAVSMEVAEAMALGAQEKARVSHALSVSGIAGPDGGSEEKPVGTVTFALATPDKLYSQRLNLPQWGRGRIRGGSAMICLDMLRRELMGLPVFGRYSYRKGQQTREQKL